MKYRVTFKDPDGPYDCATRAAKESMSSMSGLSEEEAESLLESRADDLREAQSKWFHYGEYVTLEIDTEADTCTVIKP